MANLPLLWQNNSNIILGKAASRNLVVQHIVRQAAEEKHDLFIVTENANELFGKCLKEHGYQIFQYGILQIGTPIQPPFRSKTSNTRTAVVFSGNPTTQTQARDTVEQAIKNIYEQANKNGMGNCANLTLVLNSFAGPIPYNHLMSWICESANASIHLFLLEDGIEKISKSYGTILKNDILKNSNVLYAGPQTDTKTVDEIIRKTRTQINRYEHTSFFKKLICKFLNEMPEWTVYQEETSLEKLPVNAILFFAPDHNKIEIPQVQTIEVVAS